ncbi:bifunctional lysylphosphatidylglycerol synthetase/lysine--tRNA ligase LysX [Corynebacterium macclintockiae]|uniref:bifunctional lysylphosphatidylglycerol synthetase/lysine--tRNA ligase LysX n=1 Tax=Corynebacterium macclintockiae TaxID=2913501 RepID=UPI003EBE2455
MNVDRRNLPKLRTRAGGRVGTRAGGRAAKDPLATQAFFPRFIGTILCAYALMALVLSISSAARVHVRQMLVVMDNVFLPVPVPSVAWSAALLVLGVGLYKAKRAAWVVAVAALLILNVSNVLLLCLPQYFDPVPQWAHSLFVTGMGVQFLLLLLMLRQRRDFFTHTVKGAILGAFLTWLVGTVAVFLIALVLVHVFHGNLSAETRTLWSLNHSAGFSLFNHAHVAGTPPKVVSFLVSALAAVVLLLAGLFLLRSHRDEYGIGPEDEAALRALIRRFNTNDSLAYFATRRDKSVVYEPKGRAAVTYRIEAGVCLASADPIGDPRYWDQAISAWLDRARSFGWVPAVMGASEPATRAYERHGLSSIHLGDEAVIDTQNFRLSELREVRQARAHAQKAGVRVRIRRHGELSAEEMQRVEVLADQWRDTTDERGFSMALGRLGDPQDKDCLLAEALVGEETVAVLSFIPWGLSGASLDLMRRSPSAPNGTVETMIVALCTEAKLQKLSLNFAVFRELFASEDAVAVGPVRRQARRVLTYLSKWWQMETLYRSNQKYKPVWIPRYVCYPDSLSMARVGLASGIAEGFVPTMGALFNRSGSEEHRGYTSTATSQPEAAQALNYVEQVTDANKQTTSEQTAVRIKKAMALRESGVEPWPVADPIAGSGAVTVVRCAEVAEGQGNGSDAHRGDPLRVSGRIVAKRDFGGVTFFELRDASGTCQLLVEVPGEQLAWKIRALDLGDLVAATGVRGESRTGEPSLLVDDITVEAKDLHPLQRRGAGIGEVNQRLRARSVVNAAIRSTLDGLGYMEVETPILQRVHGGANARPFKTRSNAANQDLYLRIAPELYLKRLLTQGAEKVYELGRVFRNEGVDATHNPEFTTVEAYAAHGDYESMRLVAQKIIQAAATAYYGEPVVMDPEGKLVSIAEDFPVKTVYGAISERLGQTITPETDFEQLLALCADRDIAVQPGWDAGEVVQEMYEQLVECTTTTPTFYTDFPTSVSPLTRQHRSRPGVAERWDLVAWGVELGTAYSELTDPLEQRDRLEAQSLKAAGGDPEAMEVDEAFLRALENGMPPTGGLGLGVDRLIMLLTGRSIREVLSFPAHPGGQ